MKNLLPITKNLAALIVVLIISSSVYSQKNISSVNTGTKAIINTELSEINTGSIKINNKAENWMKNKSYLGENNYQLSITELFIINEKVVENENDIEEWMTNSRSWKITPGLFDDNYPDNFELEEWMFDENFWQIKDDTEFYPIEAWMDDSKFWVMVK